MIYVYRLSGELIGSSEPQTGETQTDTADRILRDAGLSLSLDEISISGSS